MSGDWTAIISAILAATALVGSWVGWRSGELRRDDVLDWAGEAITTLTLLRLICSEDSRERVGLAGRIDEVRVATSALVERGRLFFRNVRDDRHGMDKEPAYRGRRPLILDQLVVAHQIARDWPGASADDRPLMRLVADDCLKKFVSLMQKEVGRDRTASIATAQSGDGTRLRILMEQVAAKQRAPGA